MISSNYKFKNVFVKAILVLYFLLTNNYTCEALLFIFYFILIIYYKTATSFYVV